jgi:hypothetical protein
LISYPTEVSLVKSTLTEVKSLKRAHGFLYQWYDTTNGRVIRNPGDIDCSQEPTPTQDNCYFLSAVDNGWYASGLVVARQALPEVRGLASRLLGDMDFSIFYDDRAQKPGRMQGVAVQGVVQRGHDHRLIQNQATVAD